jgi:hypothetical protein
MPQDLTRLEWHKKARANLRAYLARLESALASRSLGNMTATEQLIAEVKRRLAMLDELIAEAKPRKSE